MRIRLRALHFVQVAKTNLVSLCESKQASCCAKSDAEMVPGPFVCLLVGFFSSSVRFLNMKNSSQRRLLLLLCLVPRRVRFARPWTQASKPALTDSSPAAERRAEALHLLFFSTKHPSPPPVSYTHLRAHETSLHLVCRLLL